MSPIHRPIRHGLRIRLIVAISLASMSAGPMLASQDTDSTRAHRVAVGDGLHVALHRYSLAVQPADAALPAVLFLHGSTFPTKLSSGYVFQDGSSWMKHLSLAGFDVWGLDFLGYGDSDRYPSMLVARQDGKPLGRVHSVVAQVVAATAYMQEAGVRRISIVAHSWGTMVAGRFTQDQPELVERLVLFGAISPRNESGAIDASASFKEVTAEQQLARFAGQVPEGQAGVLVEPRLEIWGPAYLSTDPEGRDRHPPAVRVPYGPTADVLEAWSGKLPYEPARILVPTLLIQGEWDPVATPGDTAWLFDALAAAPEKRSVLIGRGTHLLQLEHGRFELYEEVAAFLAASRRDTRR